MREKKCGAAVAKEWIKTASIQQRLKVARSRFEYGVTLNDLIADGFNVPESADPIFSWGFLKQVKASVFHAMYRP